MKEFYKVFKQMEARPGMYTGDITLKSMSTYYNGYTHAIFEYSIKIEKQTTEPHFHDWVAKKLGFSESTAGWHRMILASTMQIDPKRIKWSGYDADATQEQHKASITKFYELLEEYMDEQS